MARKQRQNHQGRSSRPVQHMTSLEFRAIAFVSTLVLAGIAIMMRINEPVVWGFLGTAIGIAIGQAMPSPSNK